MWTNVCTHKHMHIHCSVIVATVSCSPQVGLTKIVEYSGDKQIVIEYKF